MAESAGVPPPSDPPERPETSESTDPPEPLETSDSQPHAGEAETPADRGPADAAPEPADPAAEEPDATPSPAGDADDGDSAARADRAEGADDTEGAEDAASPDGDADAEDGAGAGGADDGEDSEGADNSAEAESADGDREGAPENASEHPPGQPGPGQRGPGHSHGHAAGYPPPSTGYGYSPPGARPPYGAGHPAHPHPWAPPRPLPPRPPRALPATPSWLLPAACGAGLVAALSMPDDREGLGLAIAAGAVGLVLVRGARSRWSGWSLGFALVVTALVLVAVVRDAEWVVVPSLLAAVGLVSLAVSGAGRHWLGAFRGGLSPLLVLPWVPRFLFARSEAEQRRRKWGPVLAGVAITVPLVGIFGMLFASADPMFARVVGEMLDWDGFASLPFRIFVFVVAAVFVAAAVLVARESAADPEAGTAAKQPPRMIWAIPLTTLNLLFATFVAVQATALFGGDERVQSTTGLTYAEYAREGFFQLVTVAVFVLVVVAVACWLVGRDSGVDRQLMLVLLGVLCFLTLVVLASAWHRLDLYTDVFALTRLRAAVGGTILWIGSLFVLLLAAGALTMLGRGTSWVPRTAILTTGVALVLFAAWNPDARIAESQVARDSDTVDTWYLESLSADAVPALAELPGDARTCALRRQAQLLDEPDGWSSWNHARQRARAVLAEAPAGSDAGLDCPTGRWDEGVSRYD